MCPIGVNIQLFIGCRGDRLNAESGLAGASVYVEFRIGCVESLFASVPLLWSTLFLGCTAGGVIFMPIHRKAPKPKP